MKRKTPRFGCQHAKVVTYLLTSNNAGKVISTSKAPLQTSNKVGGCPFWFLNAPPPSSSNALYIAYSICWAVQNQTAYYWLNT